MKHYKKYVLPYKWYFILGPLCMIAEVIGEIVLPFLMAKIINIGAANQDIPYIFEIGGLMLLCIIVMLVGGVGGSYFASKAAMNFGADLRKDLFQKVQNFSFSNIDRFSTGSLVTRLTNDVTQLQNLIMQGLKMMLRAPGMLIGGVVMAIAINGQLATVLAIILPILAIVLAILIRTAYPRFNKMQVKIDDLNNVLQENLTNIRVVKSFVRENHERKKFAGFNEDLRETSMSALKIIVVTMPVMTFAVYVTTLLVVWFGGNQVLFGNMEVGDLTAFTTYIVQILMALMMTAMVLLQSSRAIASAKRISEVLETEIDLNDDEATEKERKVEKGEVQFKNVSFGYDGEEEHQILKDISFTIPAGKIVGIVGATGSGKTSLVQLIPRLYDVKKGEVLVDGINVKEYSLKNLRDGVGMVLQKNILFSGSIRDNLLWGDEHASEEEMKEAAKSAQADPFIQTFVKGYETDLGQGGVNVSGGQKQRLCIARALLKKPKILILDDSTSAVDTSTEAKIRESFRTSLKDATKIIIAQRISSVIDADQIIVLEEGKIVGIGKHEELLNNCNAYQEIYYSQSEKKEVEA